MGTNYFHSDMQLVIDHRVDWERYFRLRHGPGVNVAEEVETFKTILRTAADVCRDIEARARGHWHEEVQLVDGRVVLPAHIVAGYEHLRAAGLLCLPLSPSYNGAGLPYLLNACFLEMVARADSSLMTIVGLQTGVAGDIEKFGSDELKQRYLPRFATGELQGAMDLTEPQAGSDLGGILTKVSEDNGRYFIDGEKIYITNGGAPIHLVLARDARTFARSKGTAMGLSLLLCPATLPDGTPNRMRVTRVERKVGIHGSPTCAVEFDHAEAFLLGRAGSGMVAMLDLMGKARLGVAAQAIGVAQAAYCQARDYAAQRVQFGMPIIAQPLVKAMLAHMCVGIQAARALLHRTCTVIDTLEAVEYYLRSERSAGDPNRATLQQEAKQAVRLIRCFTPLCKYYASEISNDVARTAVQVHGGIGFMAESPAAHYHADAIITTIYEGTSEIQASFALSEMSRGGLSTTLEQLRAELALLRQRTPDLVDLVSEGIDKWLTASIPPLMANPQHGLLDAKHVCAMVSDVVAATELLQQARLSEEKRVLAAAFVRHRMLAVEMNARRISNGDTSRIEQYDRILGL